MVQSIDKIRESQELNSLDVELTQILLTMSQSLKIELLHYAEYLIGRHSQNNSESIPRSEISKKMRQAGLLKGKIRMSDDFDEPLEDMKDYM
jgi:hypothetical protein